MKASQALDIATNRVQVALRGVQQAHELVRVGGSNYRHHVFNAEQDLHEAKATLTAFVDAFEKAQQQDADDDWVRFWLAAGAQRVSRMEQMAGVPMSAAGRKELLNGR